MKFVKKIIFSTLVSFFVLHLSTFAAPPADEVNTLLSEMNWTTEELENYLAFYDLTLEDFDTTEELTLMLGTPITEENLTDLLQNHGLTEQELTTLLGEFGETLEDYHFIEDLDTVLDFYLNHEEDILGIEEFLANVGLTEDEVDTLFTHLLSLDETVMEEEMNNIMSKLEPYMMIEDPAELSAEQQEELLGIWEEMLTAFHLKANFYLVNGTKTAISFNALTSLEALNGNNVLIELYDLQDNMLLDMQLSAEMLASDFVIEAGEEMVHVGEMAGELTNQLHAAKLPDTASPYWLNMLLSIILIISGFAFYHFFRKQELA